jgi:hypothetical protein
MHLPTFWCDGESFFFIVEFGGELGELNKRYNRFGNIGSSKKKQRRTTETTSWLRSGLLLKINSISGSLFHLLVLRRWAMASFKKKLLKKIMVGPASMLSHFRTFTTAAHVARACLVLKRKKNAQYSSHRIFGHMYGALNVGKKITNCTICL